MKLATVLLGLVALSVGACSSSVKDAIDGTLQKRIDTMNSCFPDLYEKADRLFEIAESWRMNGQPIADPAGLTWNIETDGSITVNYVISGCTLSMVIRFYSPVGVEQNLTLGSPSTLNEAIGTAADELRTLFGATDKFMVGAWTLTGPNANGSGAITGIIGGTTNQNELESLSTTTATPSGGPPPNADGTVVLTAATTCNLTFNTAALQTDTVVDQDYPIGTVTATIAGPDATVVFTITFNNTVIATITVNDVPGSFSYNLDTGDLDYDANG